MKVNRFHQEWVEMLVYEFPFTYDEKCVESLAGKTLKGAMELLRTNAHEAPEHPDILGEFFSSNRFEYFADKYSLPSGQKPERIVRVLRTDQGFLDLLIQGGLVAKVIAQKGPSLLSLSCLRLQNMLFSCADGAVDICKKMFFRKYVPPAEHECANWATAYFPEAVHAIAAKASAIICDNCRKSLAALKADSRFVEDLRMDDLDTLNLLNDCETIFRLEFRADEFEPLETVAELIDFLHSRIKTTDDSGRDKQ
jgi:acyl carrier protein